MSGAKALLATFWYALLLVEFTIWVATIDMLGWTGLVSLLAFATIIPLLLAVEGLELAVASLLNWRASLSPAAACELDRIKSDPTLSFFPNRQLAVVISIVMLTMASGFERIYVPVLGWTSGYNLPTIFNIVFPTHTVLLLAQVPGKMLGLNAPARFLDQTWRICVGVRWIGLLEVTAPAKPIVKFLAILLRYPVLHAAPAPEVRLLYPVYDYIDSRWYYLHPEDDGAAAGVR
jgi:hypothetical protein